MEESGAIGNVGSQTASVELAEEKVSASVQLGPLKLSLVGELDNKALIALVAAKLPGGVAHTIVVDLQNALFPVAK